MDLNVDMASVSELKKVPVAGAGPAGLGWQGCSNCLTVKLFSTVSLVIIRSDQTYRQIRVYWDSAKYVNVYYPAAIDAFIY